MAENRCNCEQATCYPEGPCGHEEVAALRAEVAFLRGQLEKMRPCVESCMRGDCPAPKALREALAPKVPK